MTPMRTRSIHSMGMLILVLAGCGSPHGPLAPGRGKVTLDGKPLTDGFVKYVPTESNSLRTFPSGKIDATGAYQVFVTGHKGIPYGSYKATVVVLEREGEPAKVSVPSKYSNWETTPLKVEVSKDSKEADFDLNLVSK